MENFGVFILTALAAAILPGADFALVTKNTLAAGRSGGQLSACGVCLGSFGPHYGGGIGPVGDYRPVGHVV